MKNQHSSSHQGQCFERSVKGLHMVIVFSIMLISWTLLLTSPALAQDDEAAGLQTPDAEKIRAKTELKGDFIETLIMGRIAMDRAAVQIAGQIGPTVGDRPVVIYKKEYVSLLISYQTMLKRLAILETQFDGVEHATCVTPHAEIIGASVAPLTALASTVVGWLGLFRTDVTFTGREFDIGEKEIVAKLFAKLRSRPGAPSFNLYYPDEMFPTVDFTTIEWNDHSNSELIKRIYTVVAKRDAAAKNLCKRGFCPCDTQTDRFNALNAEFNGFLEAVGLEGLKLTGVPPIKEKVPDAEGPKPAASPAASPAAAKKDEAKGVTVNVNCKEGEEKKKDDGGGGGDLLSLFLQAERLYHLMIADKASAPGYWLSIQVVKAGGNIRVKSSPLIDIFRGGNSVKFSGGIIIVYNLYNFEGRSVGSDTVPIYVPYKSSKNIPK